MDRRRLLGSALNAAIGFSFLGQVVLAETETPPRGGLGLTGKEWKDKWGEPDAEVKGKYWKYEYKRFGVVVKLIYLEPDEHIISFDVTPAAPVPASLLYQNIEHFIPEDALYIEDYPRPLGPGTVSRFNSEWLAKRFLSLNDPVVSDWFPGGNPGDFILLYEEDATGNVDNVIVGLGNNP